MGDSIDAPAGKTVTAKWIYRTLLASAAMSLAACETPQPQYPTSDNYKAPPPIPAPQPQYPATDSTAPPPAADDHAPTAAPTTGVDTQSLPPAEKAPSSWLAPASGTNPYLIRASYEVILADATSARAAKGKPKAHTPPKTKADRAAPLRGSQERAEPEDRADRDEGETSERGARAVKVKKGETLDAIVRQTGVSKDALIEANGLKRPFHVVAGRTLKIPRGEEASAETSRGETSRGEESRGEPARSEAARAETERVPKTPRAYVAKPGDTVYALARRFKIAPGEIEAANGYGRDVRLHPGQRVLLPRPPGEAEEPAAAPPRREAAARRPSEAELAENAPAPEPRTSPRAVPAPETPSSSSQSFLRPYPLASAGPSPSEAPGQPVPYSAMTSSALSAPPQKPLPHANYAAQGAYSPPATPSYTAPAPPTRPSYTAPVSSYSAPSTPQPYSSLGQPYVAPPVRPIAPPVEAAPPPTDAEVVLAGRGRFAGLCAATSSRASGPSLAASATTASTSPPKKARPYTRRRPGRWSTPATRCRASAIWC